MSQSVGETETKKTFLCRLAKRELGWKRNQIDDTAINQFTGVKDQWRQRRQLRLQIETSLLNLWKVAEATDGSPSLAMPPPLLDLLVSQTMVLHGGPLLQRIYFYISI